MSGAGEENSESAPVESVSQRLGPGAPKLGELKSRALLLKAEMRVGHEGVTESWLRAMDDTLERHELVKVKLTSHKEEKREVMRAIEEKTGSVCVQRVGFTATYYRKRKGK